MAKKHWVGMLRGARVGPLYWAEDENGEGILSFTTSDNQSFSFRTVRGQAGKTTITLLADKPDENSPPAPLGSLNFEDMSEISCAGTWQLVDGSKGIFELFVSSRGVTEPDKANQLPSPKLWNKEIPLGAVTLYRRDLESLIAELETHIPENASTIIRATEGGQVIIQDANEYLSRKDLLDVLTEITISREENVTPGYKKIITVTLNNNDQNNVTASSPEELWTLAASQRVAIFMENFTSALTGFLRRHGLNVNSFLLVGLVVVLPDYAIKQRIGITIGVILFILIIARSHKFIRFARVYLDIDRIKRPFSKEIPSAMLAIAAASITAGFSALPSIVDFLQKLIKSLF